MGAGQRQPVTRLSRGLATAIRVQMARRGMDMTTLASAAGLSLPYVSKRLAGQYVFTVFDIEQVAQALGMEPEALMVAAVEESAGMPAGDDN